MSPGLMSNPQSPRLPSKEEQLRLFRTHFWLCSLVRQMSAPKRGRRAARGRHSSRRRWSCGEEHACGRGREEGRDQAQASADEPWGWSTNSLSSQRRKPRRITWGRSCGKQGRSLSPNTLPGAPRSAGGCTLPTQTLAHRLAPRWEATHEWSQGSVWNAELICPQSVLGQPQTLVRIFSLLHWARNWWWYEICREAWAYPTGF